VKRLFHFESTLMYKKPSYVGTNRLAVEKV